MFLLSFHLILNILIEGNKIKRSPPEWDPSLEGFLRYNDYLFVNFFSIFFVFLCVSNQLL